jgi:hypothetical protein
MDGLGQGGGRAGCADPGGLDQSTQWHCAPALHSWHEQESKHYACHEAADVINDADVGIGEAPHKVECQPEEPAP